MKTIVQNRSISLRFLPIRAVQTVEACPGKAFIYRIPHIRQDCKHIPHINMQLLFVSDMRKKSTGIAHCVRIREAVCQIMCRLSQPVIIHTPTASPRFRSTRYTRLTKKRDPSAVCPPISIRRWSFNDKGPASFCCLCARSN